LLVNDIYAQYILLYVCPFMMAKNGTFCCPSIAQLRVIPKYVQSITIFIYSVHELTGIVRLT